MWSRKCSVPFNKAMVPCPHIESLNVNKGIRTKFSSHCRYSESQGMSDPLFESTRYMVTDLQMVWKRRVSLCCLANQIFPPNIRSGPPKTTPYVGLRSQIGRCLWTIVDLERTYRRSGTHGECHTNFSPYLLSHYTYIVSGLGRTNSEYIKKPCDVFIYAIFQRRVTALSASANCPPHLKRCYWVRKITYRMPISTSPNTMSELPHRTLNSFVNIPCK